MRRIIPVIAVVVLILSTSPALAQNQQILKALQALNGMPESFSTPIAGGGNGQGILRDGPEHLGQ